MKYKLIHIDTLVVTMCEKITIKGCDYYVSEEKVFKNGIYAYCKFSGLISKERNGQFNYKLIATTNTSLQCPQVVDYIEGLAISEASKIYEPPLLEEEAIERFEYINGFIDGYQKHSETHSLSDEEVLELIQSLKDYTRESRNVLGFDDREPIEFLEIFKSTLPIKIYYR